MICLSQHPLFRIHSSKNFPILFCQCNVMTPKSRIGYTTPCKFSASTVLKTDCAANGSAVDSADFPAFSPAYYLILKYAANVVPS